MRLALLVDHLYLVPEGLFNVITGIMATYLFTFLIFAGLLQIAGGNRIIMDLAHALGSGFVGGPAKVAVVSSALMGTVSGSTTANVVTTGSITIPLMKRHGFRAIEAAAIETAAGVGGALMPPMMGAGVFIMSEVTGIPLLTILGYSILPAILYFSGVFAYVHVKAAKRGLVGAVEAGAPPVLTTLGRGDPSGRAVGAARLDARFGLYAVLRVVGEHRRARRHQLVRRETRLTPARLVEAFERTTRGALMLTVTSACAAVVMGVITSTGLMLKITSMTLGIRTGLALHLHPARRVHLVRRRHGPAGDDVVHTGVDAGGAGARRPRRLASRGAPGDFLVRAGRDDHAAGVHDRVRRRIDRGLAADAHRWETFRVAKALYICPHAVRLFAPAERQRAADDLRCRGGDARARPVAGRDGRVSARAAVGARRGSCLAWRRRLAVWRRSNRASRRACHGRRRRADRRRSSTSCRGAEPPPRPGGGY